jgi:hypothetical protein
MDSQEKVKQLIELREKARLGGGLQKIDGNVARLK